MLANKILRKRFLIRVAGDFAWEQGVQRFGVKDKLDDFSTQKRGYGFVVDLLKKIQIKVVQSAELVVVPSQYFKGVISNWGIKPEKIKVIYNGIELSNDLGGKLSSGGKVLLSVGRLVPWKGFDVLIECMPKILKEIPDLKLKIVGGGPQQEELQKLIKETGLEDKVILTGKLPRKKTLENMKEADIFILNTQYEGFAHQLIEVANLRTPIITTNIGGNPELIRGNVDGILIVPNNKQQIISSVIKLFKDKNFREKIVENAYIKSQQFSIKKTLDNLEKVLNQ